MYSENQHFTSHRINLGANLSVSSPTPPSPPGAHRAGSNLKAAHLLQDHGAKLAAITNSHPTTQKVKPSLPLSPPPPGPHMSLQDLYIFSPVTAHCQAPPLITPD
jgi:hypothetical protein